jgi:hypothetical protein
MGKLREVSALQASQQSDVAGLQEATQYYCRPKFIIVTISRRSGNDCMRVDETGAVVLRTDQRVVEY